MTLRVSGGSLPGCAVFLLMVTAVAEAASGESDLVLYNARIFTASTAQPYADAIAIKGDRIVAVGDSKALTAHASVHTLLRDMQGRTIIPGINDAHFHLFVQPAARVLQFQADEPTWTDVTAELARAVASTAPGTIIIGDVGVKVYEDAHADRAALDLQAPAHPVILRGSTGHFYILNSLALSKLRIGEDERDPRGGVFERSATTRAMNGRTVEFATFLIHRRIAELASDAEALQQTRAFMADASRYGITSVQHMSMPLSPARLVKLFEQAPTPIRERVMHFMLTDRRESNRERAVRFSQQPAPLITVSGTKWVFDGTPIEHTAAFRSPYADLPGTSGQMNFTQAEMEPMLRESLRADQQMVAHIIGDRTTEIFLKAMEATGGKVVWGQRRVRIEHGCGLAPDLIARAKDLGVVVVIDPSHFALGDALNERLGRARLQQLEPVRALLDAGIPVALGSDGLLNPYVNIMLATTNPLRPDQALSREEAVTAYTRTSAFAEFAEREKGSLAPGQLADLAVLSQDIFSVPAADLPQTESVLTLVGGKIIRDSTSH